MTTSITCCRRLRTEIKYKHSLASGHHRKVDVSLLVMEVELSSRVDKVSKGEKVLLVSDELNFEMKTFTKRKNRHCKRVLADMRALSFIRDTRSREDD